MSQTAKEAFELMEQGRKDQRALAVQEKDKSATNEQYPGFDAFELGRLAEVYRVNVSEYTQVPGFDDYTLSLFGPNYDLPGNVLAFDTASRDLTDWIFAALPAGSVTDSVALTDTLFDGNTVPVTYTVAQTAQYRTFIDAYILALDAL